MPNNTRIPIARPNGGVSRQPIENRHPNQVQDAVNVRNSITTGAEKRPGSEIIQAIDSPSSDHLLHIIDRDPSEQYALIYGGAEINVVDLNTKRTIPVLKTNGAESYLKTNTPLASDIRMVTISDYTLITNSKAPAKAKRSTKYTVAVEHPDRAVLLSHTPADKTYHRAEEGTPSFAPGFWQYDVGGHEFPTMSLEKMGTSDGFNKPARFSDDDVNPGGFKITFKDKDGNSTTYDVKIDMRRHQFDNVNNTMHDVAAEFQRAIQNAGASDALVYWEADQQNSKGQMIVTAPERGTSAAVVSTSAPSDGDIFNWAKNAQVFDDTNATTTAGSGNPPQTARVAPVDRWKQMPPPDQEEAEPDPTTMPVRLRRLPGNFFDRAMDFSPDQYWRLGEESGASTAINEVSPDNGTYGGPTLGEPSLVYPLDDTSAKFGGGDYVGVQKLGTLGSSLAGGVTFVFFVKNTKSTRHAVFDIKNAKDGNGTVHPQQCLIEVGSDLRFYIEDWDGVTLEGTGGSGLDDGNAHIVALRKSSTHDITLEIDGKQHLVTQTNNGIGNFFDFSDAGFLGLKTSLNDGLVGTLDDFAIWERELSDKETSQLHQETNSTGIIFDLSLNDWSGRPNGTALTNPAPSILRGEGKPIRDIAFHRGRLAIAGDENIVFSRVGDLFQFYIADHENFGDDDRIDAPIQSTSVSIVEHVQPFRKGLLITTLTSQQYELNAPEVLTANTASITPSTAYETSPGVEPAVMGNEIYFVGEGEGTSLLYEYFYDDNRAATSATDVSKHVERYLPAEARQIAASPNAGTVIVLPEKGDYLYKYTLFWNGNEKAQSAWSQDAPLDALQLRGVAVLESQLITLGRDNANNRLHLERRPLTPDAPESALGYTLHVDYSTRATGTYDANNDETTWKITPEFGQDTAVYTGTGEEIPATFATSGGERVVTASGDWTAHPALIGFLFQSSLTLTTPTMKTGDGTTLRDGRLQLSRLHVHHHDTGGYDIELTQTARPTRTTTLAMPTTPPFTLHDAGSLSVVAMGRNRDIEATIRSTNQLPLTITGGEWIGTFTRRRT